MKVNPGINLDTCFMYMSGFQNEVRKWKKIQKINETLFCKFHMTWNSLHFLYSLHCHKNNQHKFRSTAPTQTPFSAFPLKLKIQPFILLFQWTNWQERGNGEYKKNLFNNPRSTNRAHFLTTLLFIRWKMKGVLYV